MRFGVRLGVGHADAEPLVKAQYARKRMALTSPECASTPMDNLVILQDDQTVRLKVRTMEVKVRQHVKIGVATAVTALALFGGASPASACSEADTDPDQANLANSDLAEQLTCQVGEGNKNITINQTNNISIGGDLDGDLSDFIFPPELD
ncbi:hypothetical protein AB0N14_26855 [Streptomyces sp. NPDC051104]|uniref:hypothetical protein n=1 Tax=Streptomyces sp. NPDC051104 TaxID=3155044 RepID=UPI003416F5EF